MEKAAIYARFSSHNQREESIDQQLRICRQWAGINGFQVVKEYQDSALSGTTDKRPGFQQMIKESEKGQFSVLLIYAHDRFARNRYDSSIYKSKLKRNGVRVISVTMPLDDSPESAIMDSIMEGYAEYYSLNLARSVKRGMDDNALHCKSNGAIPLGYKSDHGSIVIDPIGSKAVQLIFEMYAAGKPLKTIAAELNNQGYKTNRGGPFRVNSLSPVLRNERYRGVYMYGDHRVEGGIPRIISDDLWSRTRNERKVRRVSKNSKSDYILTDKIYCGNCGEPITGESGTSSTGSVYHYYKCNGRKYKKKCNKAVVRQDDLEKWVLDAVRQEILTDENIDLIADKAYSLIDEEYRSTVKLEVYTADLKDVEGKIENILKAIEAGIFTSATKSRLEDLECERDKLEKLIAAESIKQPEFTKDHIVFWLESFRDGNIDDIDFQRSLIKALVNSIYLYDQEDGSQKLVIAINVKNGTTITLSRSLMSKLVNQCRESENTIITSNYAIFQYRKRF